jgi:cytochrome c peroxidase
MSKYYAGFFRQITGFVLVIIVVTVGWLFLAYKPPAPWSDSEKVLMRSLWLDSLPPLPVDPSNSAADDSQAATLGHALFFDAKLSVNGEVSCASCHQPEKRFSDDLEKARAVGQSRRNTPSIIGLAYSPWLYWDGRRDSLWSQALSPLEDPNEHGSNRMHVARLVTEEAFYRDLYQEVFGNVPDFSNSARFPEAAGPGLQTDWNLAWEQMAVSDRQLVDITFANVGKAIAAYERLLLPSPSRFDVYAETILTNEKVPGDLFTNDEAKGLRLFMGKGRCMECHNGPLFTNFEFHNTGILSFPGDLPDRGRIDGVREVRTEPFNCFGAYSDARPGQCLELTFARDGIELIGAMKSPSLRNLEGTAPYMHKGQLKTLTEVLDHYNQAPLAIIGHNEAEGPLGLLPFELKQLESFLTTLAAPVAVEEQWLQPPE